MTESELLTAIAKARDKQLAEFVTLVIALAAENHPEEIRKALASVFDLTAIEEMTKRMMAVINRCEQRIGDCKPLIECIHLDLDDIEKRVDYLHGRLDKAALVLRQLTNGQQRQEVKKQWQVQ